MESRDLDAEPHLCFCKVEEFFPESSPGSVHTMGKISRLVSREEWARKVRASTSADPAEIRLHPSLDDGSPFPDRVQVRTGNGDVLLLRIRECVLALLPRKPSLIECGHALFALMCEWVGGVATETNLLRTLLQGQHLGGESTRRCAIASFL